MFRQRRDDTLVCTIEAQYGINLNCRRDMLLGNLLETRGFDSLSQLLDAYYQRAKYCARKRRVFISYHYEEELNQVKGLRLMAANQNLEFDFHDVSIKTLIKSENKHYIARVLRDRIQRCSLLMCVIGNGTAWRDWVDLELQAANALGKGVCGVRARGTYGQVPKLLKALNAPLVQWETSEIISAIECAAARRS